MRFLFCSLGSQGFLYPSMGLALELKGRGHQVAFVTSQPFAELLEAAGLERIPRGSVDGPSFEVQNWHMAASAGIQTKHIEYGIREFRPDALVGQMLTMGAFLAGERQGLPVGVLGLGYYPYDLNRWSMLAHLSEAEREEFWLNEGMQGIYNRIRAAFRLEPVRDSYRETPLLGDLFLVRSVAELEDVTCLSQRVHLVGACLWEPPDEVDPTLERWLSESVAAHQPILYAQHGRTFKVRDFWEDLQSALGPEPVRVAAAVGKLKLEGKEILVGPSNFFVRAHLPQGRVLPLASGVVSSGNTTAALGAITSGLPSVMIPTGSEQPDIAQRYRTAGVARQLDPEVLSVEGLRREVFAILEDEEMRSRALALKASFDRIDGFVVAADLLEALASKSDSVLREGHGVPFAPEGQRAFREVEDAR